jgi:hypothetical protein
LMIPSGLYKPPFVLTSPAAIMYFFFCWFILNLFVVSVTNTKHTFRTAA